MSQYFQVQFSRPTIQPPSAAMTDRRTKAQLLAHIEELEPRCEGWKYSCRVLLKEKREALAELEKVQRELADRKARDRSPRRLSAASSSCRLQQTCKFDALNVVLAWERDAVVEEQKQVIQDLRIDVDDLQLDKARLLSFTKLYHEISGSQIEMASRQR